MKKCFSDSFWIDFSSICFFSLILEVLFIVSNEILSEPEGFRFAYIAVGIKPFFTTMTLTCVFIRNIKKIQTKSFSNGFRQVFFIIQSFLSLALMEIAFYSEKSRSIFFAFLFFELSFFELILSMENKNSKVIFLITLFVFYSTGIATITLIYHHIQQHK